VLLESFIARRVLTGEETKEYNKLFVEIVGALRGVKSEQIYSSLQQKLLAGGGVTRSWPTDEVVVEIAISRPVFRTNQNACAAARVGAPRTQ
jgi:hypothetical protein